jgi:hypothetical protein
VCQATFDAGERRWSVNLYSGSPSISTFTNPEAAMSCPVRILAPVDFGAASEDALRYAIAWAEQCGSELHVVHVVPDASRQSWTLDVVGIAPSSITDDWVREAYKSLDDLLVRVPVRVSWANLSAPPSMRCTSWNRPGSAS